MAGSTLPDLKQNHDERMVLSRSRGHPSGSRPHRRSPDGCRPCRVYPHNRALASLPNQPGRSAPDSGRHPDADRGRDVDSGREVHGIGDAVDDDAGLSACSRSRLGLVRSSADLIDPMPQATAYEAAQPPKVLGREFPSGERNSPRLGNHRGNHSSVADSFRLTWSHLH